MRLPNFLCYYLLPVLNVIYGLIILSNPPKTISKCYGYRTRSSIRNIDTWMLAQKCSGIVCLIVGVVLLVISVVLRFNFEAEQLCVYGILVLVVYTFVSILFQFSITEIIFIKFLMKKVVIVIKKICCFLFLFCFMFCFSCREKESCDGMFDFVIYESDSNNYDLSDNPCVSKFHIVYDNCESVTDALIKTGNRYYFDSSKVDYLVLEDGPFGLTYKSGYFSNYKPCSSGEIDVSWSMIFVDKELASSGIGNISLGNIQEVGFVIDGWKDKDFS